LDITVHNGIASRGKATAAVYRSPPPSAPLADVATPAITPDEQPSPQLHRHRRRDPPVHRVAKPWRPSWSAPQVLRVGRGHPL